LAPGIIVLLLSGEVSAGPREHDDFFLRLSGGWGSASTEIEEGNVRTELSGSTADANIAIGGSVARNLALHGTLFGWGDQDPDVEPNDNELESEQDLELAVTAIGGGLTYYFMPVNIYVSGSVGAAMLSFDTRRGYEETDRGFLGEITIGKEWWVGNSWGLGLAGAAGYHSIPDGDIDESWSGMNFALRFSATLD
jgi:hypothetical protein